MLAPVLPAVPPRSARSSLAASLVLVAAVVAGTGARVATADWGLPFAFHVDERGFVVHEALATEWRGLRHDDWTPRINTYGSLVIYGVIGMHWATQGGRERAAAVARRYGNEHEFIRGAFGFGGEAPFSMPRLLHALRLLSAWLGGLAILLLGLAARRLAGPWAGATTAVLAAFTVGLLQVGHFYTAEALMIAPQALFLFACAGLANGGRWKSAILASLALGLVAAIKLPGLAVAGALPACLVPSVARLRLRHVLRVLRRPALWLVPLGALLVFRFANPFPFEHPELYYDAVPGNRDGATVLAAQYVERQFPFLDWRAPWSGTASYGYTLTSVMPAGAGWALTLAALAALAVGIRWRRPVDRIAWLAIVPTFALVGAWAVQTVRYCLPAFPALVLVVGALVVRPRRRLGRFALAALVVLPTAAYGLAFTGLFTEPDPRIQAAEVVAERAQPGDLVVLEHEAAYTAPLGGRGSGLGWREDLLVEGTRIRRLWDRPAADPHAVGVATVSGARFLVVSEWYRRRAQAPLRERGHARFYEELDSGELGFERVATFPADPSLGPLRWDESSFDPMAICFDHCGVEVWERRPAEAPP